MRLFVLQFHLATHLSSSKTGVHSFHTLELKIAMRPVRSEESGVGSIHKTIRLMQNLQKILTTFAPYLKCDHHKTQKWSKIRLSHASIGFFTKPKAEPELPKSQSWREKAGKPKGKGKASLNQHFKANNSICMMCFSPWLHINKCCWKTGITKTHKNTKSARSDNTKTMQTIATVSFWTSFDWKLLLSTLYVRNCHQVSTSPSFPPKHWLSPTRCLCWKRQKFHFFSHPLQENKIKN